MYQFQNRSCQVGCYLSTYVYIFLGINVANKNGLKPFDENYKRWGIATTKWHDAEGRTTT